MAIKTEFEIKYKCGHKEVRDLSSKDAGKRAGYAKWLTQQKCFSCFRQDNAETDRINDLETAAAFEQANDLPPLRGTDAQLRWSPIYRFQILRKTHEELVVEGEMTEDEFDATVMTYAKKITRSGWWFDHRTADPEDMEELLRTAFHDDTESIEENPF